MRIFFVRIVAVAAHTRPVAISAAVLGLRAIQLEIWKVSALDRASEKTKSDSVENTSFLNEH